jgi:predicted nucleotidyltransferase
MNQRPEGLELYRSPETQEVEQDVRFRRVLGESIEVLERSGFAFLVLGGLAASLVGRPRWTHDIDFLVQPDDARAMLAAFARAGFATEETDPVWIFKAFKDDVMIDVIFMITGGIYLDPELSQHAIVRDYDGLRLRIPSPEDQIVIKAIVHTEETSRHWFDALAIIARSELNWEYLLHRARRGARRVLSLLIYAQSSDILVPNWVVRRLFEELDAHG